MDYEIGGIKMIEREIKGWIKHSEAYTEEEIKKIKTIAHHEIAPFIQLKPVDQYQEPIFHFYKKIHQ